MITYSSPFQKFKIGTKPIRRLGWLLPSLLLWASVVAGQEPRAGRAFYRDQVDLGFEIKVPKDWDLIPPKPSDHNLIAKYSPRHNKTLTLADGERLRLDFLLLRFDRPEPIDPSGPSEPEKGKGDEKAPPQSVQDYIKTHLPSTYGRGYSFDKDKYPEVFKGSKGVKSTLTIYVGSTNPNAPDSVETRLFVAEFALNSKTTVAILGVGPGGKKWRGYEKAYRKFAKSLQRIAVVDPFQAARIAPDANTPRGKKRLELMQGAAKGGTWTLHETEHYFVLSSINDKSFLEEVKLRLEAIHRVYEADYPKSLFADSKKSPTDLESSAAVNIVRICQSFEEYASYGAPEGSAGFWNSADQELVLYDDKANAGRKETWIALNHEAFHQFLFNFTGGCIPQPWFSEGSADYYGGFVWKDGRFQLGKNELRQPVIKSLRRDKKNAPLETLLHWDREQYYGSNELGLTQSQCYAQGWSFVYFLCNPPPRVRSWQDSWSLVLDRYLGALIETGDSEAALDFAFDQIRLPDLEAAWLESID